MFFSKKKSKHKDEFKAILSFAREVYSENPDEIYNLIRLLGRNVQFKYLSYMLKHENDFRMRKVEPRTTWFDPFQQLGISGKSLRERAIEVKETYQISLANDLVLVNPWNRQRYLSACINHGEHRSRGSWRQDDNHFAQYWLPMKMTWVGNGNHSISAGIIQRDGFLTPEEVYDISPVYDVVVCNGDKFIDIELDKPISTVKDLEFCAIYEIGRMIKTTCMDACIGKETS